MKALTKLISVIVIGIIIAFCAVVYLIKPALGQVVKLNEDLRAKKTESKTLEEQILAFKTAQSDLAKATQKDRILDSIVIREDLVDPIQNLEAAVAASGSTHELAIDNDAAPTPGQRVTPKKPIGNYPGVKEISFTLSITNDYEGLIQFLKYMENSPYFTEFSNFEIGAQASEGGDRTGRLIAVIKGVFYVQADETNPK